MIDPAKLHHQMSYLRLRSKRRGYQGVGKTATKPKKAVAVEPDTIDAAEIAWRSPGQGRRIV